MTNEEIANELEGVSVTAIATGLLSREVMLEHLKKNTGEPLELDSLKISDEERRKRFGARVRIMRNCLGMTQEDLAKKIGVTNQAVAAYEKGKREPPFGNLIRLARALNVTADWLIGTAPPPAELSPIQ